MRIKKWEKWYWGIAFTITISLTVWLLLKEEGFKGTLNGKPHTFSKTSSFLMVILPTFIFPLWIWFVLRFWFLKTNDFICKYCKKEFGGSFETEKNVCKTCYEKRKK